MVHAGLPRIVRSAYALRLLSTSRSLPAPVPVLLPLLSSMAPPLNAITALYEERVYDPQTEQVGTSNVVPFLSGERAQPRRLRQLVRAYDRLESPPPMVVTR